MDDKESIQRAAALHAIVDAVARGDLMEIGQLVRQEVESALGCQQAVILRYDAERRLFVTSSLLNQGTRFGKKELAIAEQECSWRDSLAADQVFAVRAAEVSSSAERELLGDHAVVAFAFPFRWGLELLGVVHAVNYQDCQLSDEQGAAVQEVAALLALALERAKVSARATAAEEAATEWRDRYGQLFAHVRQPVLVVDVEADLVYEANPAMVALTGYEAHELHAMRLSGLFAPGQMPDLRRLAAGPHQPSECTLQTKRGEPLRASLEVARLGAPSGKRYLLVARLPEPLDRTPVHTGDVGELLRALGDSEEVEAGIDSLFVRLGQELGARYGTLHVIPGPGQGLRMRTFRDFSQEGGGSAEIAFTTGPYQKVLQAEGVVECPSVTASQEYGYLKEGAGGAAYESFIAVALRLARREMGVVSYFFAHPRTFALEHKELVAQGARLIALLLAWTEHRRRLEQVASRAEAAIEIVAGLCGLRSAEAMVAHLARRIHPRIQFDLLSVTLFERDGGQAQALCIASPELAQLVASSYRWEAIADDGLGWLRPRGQTTEIGGQRALADKVASRVSVLLLAHGDYLGNLSLGALGEDAFSGEEVHFLRLIAPALAEALASCREEGSPESESPVPPAQAHEGTHSLRADLAVLRRALEELDPFVHRHAATEPEAGAGALRWWQAVRTNLERVLSWLEGRPAEQSSGEGEQAGAVSVQQVINEATVQLHKAGVPKDVQLVVLPGPAMEVVTRPGLFLEAIKQLLTGVVAMASGPARPRVEVGHREQLLNKLIYVRYSGPAPDLSATRAGPAQWRAANEQVRRAQQMLALCGGKLVVRTLLSGETELFVSFAKTVPLGDG